MTGRLVPVTLFTHGFYGPTLTSSAGDEALTLGRVCACALLDAPVSDVCAP